MDDHRLAHLRQDAVVHALVVGGRTRHARQRAAGHQDDAAAEFLDGRDLLFIRGDHVVDRLRRIGRQVVGASPRRDQRAGHVACGVERATDQLERGRPVQPHAALRGIHRLGHAETEAPQMLAVGNRGVPVDGAIEPRVDIGTRVGHHVRGGVGDAVEGCVARCGNVARRREAEVFERAARCWQANGWLLHSSRLHCASTLSEAKPRAGMRRRSDAAAPRCAKGPLRCSIAWPAAKLAAPTAFVALEQSRRVRARGGAARAQPRALRSSAPHMSLPAHTRPRLCRHHRGCVVEHHQRFSAAGGARWGRLVGRRASQQRARRAHRARFNI